ncbi:MAG: quinolinate synthase NadA [Pirellulales bacterium]|nr:quinolinate synthase NadA [Pirellulales bacterium]
MSQKVPPAELSACQALSPEELTSRIGRVRAAWGSRLLMLGHHYQRDDVIALCDLRGDSYQLAAQAAANGACRAIVFCGVHFMAETADILANRPEQIERRGGVRIPVILPDLAAGCSLADMADREQVEDCWAQLAEVIDPDDLTPITYVNSTAELKAFCGRHGGLVCTSANARLALEWAFTRRSRALFFPDQHLGRNTAKALGVPLERMPLWNPNAPKLGGNTAEALRRSRVILWRGFCCVHQVFQPQQIERFRAQHPGIKIIVHPECPMEVVDRADAAGSTGAIIRAVEESPPGAKWAIGTEPHLVERLKREHPEQEIHLLSPALHPCETMQRIDLPHLGWALEHLQAGAPVNVIEVDSETSRDALTALQRMLELQ